jgi:hypothetical protein
VDRSQEEEGPRVLGLSRRSVPYILAVSDAIYGLASGMTIKFFPVFWLQASTAPCLAPLPAQLTKP